VTVGLGGSMVVALNALASIPMTGSGGRFCARGPSIRSTLFLYSTIAGYRAPIDSLDPVSVFKATIDTVP